MTRYSVVAFAIVRTKYEANRDENWTIGQWKDRGKGGGKDRWLRRPRLQFRHALPSSEQFFGAPDEKMRRRQPVSLDQKHASMKHGRAAPPRPAARRIKILRGSKRPWRRRRSAPAERHILLLSFARDAFVSPDISPAFPPRQRKQHNSRDTQHCDTH